MRLRFLVISSVIFLIDQLIKIYVNAAKPDYSGFHYVSNTGAAFGLLKGANPWLAGLTFTVILAIIFLYLTKPAQFKSGYVEISAALITGGAAGNLFDRLVYGHVIDYIDVGFWPIFNIADIALSAGAIILIICYWKEN